MNSIRVLVEMQLKEKLNLKGNKLLSRASIFKFIFGILKFALVIALCFGFMFLVSFLGIFSNTTTIPSSVITIVFTIMILIQTIGVTWALTKNLYYSKDNPILLVMPCKHTQVYISKLIVFYLFELIKNLSFMIPMFMAYGIFRGMPILYYPWVLVCFIVISMIPVLVGAVLSIPMMWVYNFFRQYKRVQMVILVLGVTLLTLGVYKAIDMIPEQIDLVATWGKTYWEIQEFLEYFVDEFAVFHGVVTMVVGIVENYENVLFRSVDFMSFGFIVLTAIVLFWIAFFAVRPLFYVMASKPFEYLKRKTKPKKNRKTNKYFSILKTEGLLNIRNSDRLFNNVAIFLALPILIFFLNKFFLAMDTREFGDDLVVSFNMLIMLLITLASNAYIATVFSRDGRSSYLIKVQPYKHQPLLLSKLMVNMVFVTLSYAATFFVLMYSSKFDFEKSLLTILACYFMYLAHMFYSAELDIMNPKIEMYSTLDQSGNNPNETKSTVIAFLAAFLVFGISLFLLLENSATITYFKLMLIGLAFMIMRLHLLLNKIKLYYRENDV